MLKTRRRSKKRSYIRYVRLMKNLTLGELSYKTGIDRMHLQRIESGTVRCTEENARIIANFLGCSDWESFETKQVIYA